MKNKFCSFCSGSQAQLSLPADRVRAVPRRRWPYGILPPRSRSGNGRHERVSHRIGVIVDSNDMPVMRSHCVAKEI